MILQRLILTFKPKEIVLHVLYSTQDGPNPGTKARRRDVTQLAGTGLQDARASLDSEAGSECVGTSAFVRREDVLLAMIVASTQRDK